MLCPRYEDPATIQGWSSALKSLLKPPPYVLFDPQFYVTAIHADRVGKLPDYDYYSPSLTRSSFTSANIADYVKRTLDFEATLQISRFVSPTVLFLDFRDPWSQIAVSLAQESIDYHRALKTKQGLLVSLVVDEAALRNREALNEYLDTITAFDAKGFYVVVRRSDPLYPGSFDEASLLGLAYLTHVLAKVNGFEVVHGYTDTHAPILSVAGAAHTCTGWFSTQKQFSFKPFEEPAGGRQPKDRYTSGPLMNTVFVNPELNSIFAAKRLPEVLTGTKYDGILRPGPTRVAWPRKIATLHHWATLSRTCSAVTASKDVRTNASNLERLLQDSLALYSSLGISGITFEAMNGKRDPSLWQRVVASFRTELGL